MLLMLRKGEDTGEVVPILRLFFFAKISHNMRTVIIDGTYDIKIKRIDVVIQCFVIEE